MSKKRINLFGRWKWVAGVVAYMPVLAMMMGMLGLLISFMGMDKSGSEGLGAVARGIHLSFYAGSLMAFFSLASIIWFCILLGKRTAITSGKLLLTFLGMAFLPVIVAPICFHFLSNAVPDDTSNRV